MVKLTINHKSFEVEDGITIMEACEQANMPVPSLCYLKDLNEIGACRVCVVEVIGMERLVTACNNPVWNGMEILTNSPKVREARKTNVDLILSQHDCFCPTCIRNGNCKLQKIAFSLGIHQAGYQRDITTTPWPKDIPLIRDSGKCIKCMRCIQICDKVQSLHIWDVAKTGSRTTVSVSENRNILEAPCSFCGQCVTHCPTGALSARDDKEQLFAYDAPIADPDKVVVVSIAPAVRTAWAEESGLPREAATPGKLVAALRQMGFQYVFDTNYAADLTIMEEGSEFLERLSHKEDFDYPLFTSCCPGWVRFLKSQYPELTTCLSTAKSPQQMQGTIIKTYFAKVAGIQPENIYHVSIMPCMAKKAEADIPTINDSGAGKDVDLVLTTRELIRQCRSMNIDFSSLEEEEFDSPLGTGTGAGVIFGATGGVMEAALRSCYYLVTGKNADADAFKEIRGMDGWRESSIDINNTTIKTAVVNGLGNARKLIEALLKGEVQYDFVEVMACPGGCVGGGGQPIHLDEEETEDRREYLYSLDQNAPLRFSHENPEIQKTYEDFLEKPLSHLAHELLHTDHTAWTVPGTKKIKPE
ncbi:[FeFe] hydrogenase, group A [Velocimicrobium porci]|uniref:2Fe-2S iron-sulfur cluster binding domain-containing protein n=1 Tax=Velocimicrobium porci TaxID=2606634 RepID=A0A6L5XVN4_9FIRM|nr:[FeFe] hydrogenase, group A [Velocimicrobium porci]MSS62669.1 2Fe-2S iron-sulfur cluster binding domain-containing protein [Velocimicrobium porci]